MRRHGSAIVLVAATLALIVTSPVSESQSFSDLVFEDAFDFASSDIDGDGIRNGSDRCNVYSLTDNLPLFDGCAALDLVDKPFQVVDPINSELEGVQVRIRGLAEDLDVEGMRQVAGDLGTAMATLEDVAFDVKAGEVCAAGAPVSNFGQPLDLVDDALAELRSRIAERIAALPDTRPDDDFADHTNEDLILINMQIAEAGLSAAQGRTAKLVGVYDELCADGLSSMEVRDTIETYDPAIGRVLMKSGLEVAMTSDFASIDDLYPDRQVSLQGLMVADSSMVADSIAGVGDQIEPDSRVLPTDCIQLRIVPVQRRPPFFSGPFLHHGADGYKHSDGHHYLEGGTGFVADTSNCPDNTSQAGEPYPRYSLELELDYSHVKYGATSKTLAFDLHHQYAPAYLPKSIHPGIPATLTVVSRWQSCTDPGTPLPPNPDDCSEPQVQSTETLSLAVKPRGLFCGLQYEDTVFDLEDDDLTGFRRTRVISTSLSAPFTGIISYQFEAEGYASPSPDSSSFPVPTTVTGSDYFAIHNQDFFDPDKTYSSALNGVDKPSGLRWPRLAGSANGLPFSYSCTLPDIVRDAIHFCPDTPDTYYRLPFSGGWPTWIMGQGNNGDFTHSGAQAFAFDFKAKTGTLIRAPRGGTVVFVRENQNANSYDDPDCNCMANALVIRHQDGKETVYFHMPENGVSTAVGAEVKRGYQIAWVGNTGYSTDPHLHFHEQIPGSGGTTTPSRFQAYSAEPPAPLVNCWVPESGDLLFSNNDP